MNIDNDLLGKIVYKAIGKTFQITKLERFIKINILMITFYFNFYFDSTF